MKVDQTNQASMEAITMEEIKRLFAAKRTALPSCCIVLELCSSLQDDALVFKGNRLPFRKTLPMNPLIDMVKSFAAKSFGVTTKDRFFHIVMTNDDGVDVVEWRFLWQGDVEALAADVLSAWSSLCMRALSASSCQ